MDSIVRVTLEHVVAAADTPESLELAGVILEIPISTFVIVSGGDVHNIPGTPVLGLIRRSEDNTIIYDLRRDATALPMESDDTSNRLVQSLLRINLRDPDDPASARSACYPLVQESTGEVEEDPTTDKWWFLIQREGEPPGPFNYHLIYLFGAFEVGGSPGGVEAYLEATRTDCDSKKLFHQLRCRLYKQ